MWLFNLPVKAADSGTPKMNELKKVGLRLAWQGASLKEVEWIMECVPIPGDSYRSALDSFGLFSDNYNTVCQIQYFTTHRMIVCTLLRL